MSLLTSIDKKSLQKFDIPGPRYTSYPTAPEWNQTDIHNIYVNRLQKLGSSDKTLSLYTHIPFCQSLCTFCACNVLIRSLDRKYADTYLTYLYKEMAHVAGYIGRRMKVKQYHWGGGTPNFLSTQQMIQLFEVSNQYFEIESDGEIAIEIDPRTISFDQLKILKQLGFNRISLGVQDFCPEVQVAINRIQPFDLVQKFTVWARELGFNSINFDLIYGLPNQTADSFKDTIGKVLKLRPNRIALYSFAYVPWLKKHQNKIDLNRLPSSSLKLDLFLIARANLCEHGYESIAMDHFALLEDSMTKAYKSGKLYRNFMGYTVKPADEYVGLGLTSIGFIENTFIQNTKLINQYYQDLEIGRLPVERGKALTDDDQVRQWVIRSLMCEFRIDKNKFEERFQCKFSFYFRKEIGHIENCIADQLVEENMDSITVTRLGRIFIRNICMGFDYYLNSKEKNPRFSRTV